VVDWISVDRFLGCTAAIPTAWLDAYAGDRRNHPPYYSNRGLPQTKSRQETLIFLWSAAAWRRFVIVHYCARPKRRQAAALQNRLDLSYSFGNNAPVWGIF